jgi:hypothetical protein
MEVLVRVRPAATSQVKERRGRMVAALAKKSCPSGEKEFREASSSKHQVKNN